MEKLIKSKVSKALHTDLKRFDYKCVVGSAVGAELHIVERVLTGRSALERHSFHQILQISQPGNRCNYMRVKGVQNPKMPC